MKTIIDFLKENDNVLKIPIGNHEITFQLQNEGVLMLINEWAYLINFSNVEFDIQDALYEDHQINIRFCDFCGKPYDAGFVAGDGDWYCCEECFEDAMNNDYGNEGWRETEDEGEYGGFYEYLNASGKWEDTGIYYTEWN